MPGNSPIVINSSSPAAFRLPSETPQPEKQTPIATESSSPGLPSPSTFFIRLTAPSLRAGSRAQEVPEGANKGFASAASLLKSNYFGDQPAESENGFESTREERATKASDSEDDVAKKIARKLSRPKKTAKETPVRRERQRSISPLQEFLYRDSSPRVESAAGNAFLRSPSLPKASVEATEQQRRSISLSAYDCNPGGDDGSNTATPAAKPAKKSRRPAMKEPAEDSAKPANKRHTKPKEAGDAATKKPRKKLEKSASIILNSDDLASTQFRVLDAETIGAGKRTDSVPDEDKPKRAPVAKTKKGPKKANVKSTEAKPSSKPSVDVEHMPDQSVFNGALLPIDAISELPKLDPVKHDTAAEPVQNASTPVQASRRRLSWTPAKNTSAAVLERPTTASSTKSNDKRPTLSLAALVGNLGYVKHDHSVSSHRSVSGEALTKRRRIELADEATRAPVAPNTVEVAPAEPKKKEKAPKKKPQTITALATKAYETREDPPPNAAQASVSAFFAPQSADKVTEQQPETASDEKSKKARKPRTKKPDDGTAASKPGKVAKSSKATKVKVRFNEADYLPPLYTPSQARVEEKRQDFLFGTSSQLAAEESPTIIQQMQLAVRGSEMWPASQMEVSPTRKSCARVPSGPHGTDLQLGQADKELWFSAARDEERGLLQAAYESRSSPRKHTTLPKEPSGIHIERRAAAPVGIDAAPTASRVASPEPNRTSDRERIGDSDHEIVDLRLTSPVAEKEHESTKPPQQSAPNQVLEAELPTTNTGPHVASDDEWMMLEIDEAVPDISHNHPSALTASSLLKAAVPSLKRSATSPIRRMSVLQVLDGNTHLLAQTSPQKVPASSQLREFTTTVPSQDERRPRGRPRKYSSADATVSPKKRGRPPKQIATVNVSPFKPAVTPSQLSTSEYVNIDDIDDPEAHVTPSPPRRRANSSPAVQELDFAAAASPLKKSKAPTAATLKLKPDDSNWATIMADIFPKITSTVRSTPPSTDMGNPTWHEKILLYDPVVLEDLTAWLNEQGVRIETRRVKVKPKTKGRKKKDADAESVEQEPEYETIAEELRPWMVQKWCEERSICCLWKEGLRGGDTRKELNEDETEHFRHIS